MTNKSTKPSASVETAAPAQASIDLDQEVPLSINDTGVIGPFGPKGSQLMITLSPVSVFLKSKMEFDIRSLSPASFTVQQIRNAVIDVAETGDMIVEDQRSVAADLLRRHYLDLEAQAALARIAADKDQGSDSDEAAKKVSRHKPLSDSETRQAQRIIADIQLADQNIAHMIGHFTHHLNIQSLVATAYAVTKVEDVGPDGLTPWSLDREGGKINEAQLTELSDRLSDTEFQLLTLAAFNRVFLKASTVKNSEGR